MLVMMEIFLLALAVVALAPDTPLGKTLRVWLIDAPVRAAAKLTPAKIIIGAIVLVCLIGMALSAPELVAMIGFGDLAVYFDAVVIAALVAAATRMRFVLAHTVRLSRNLSARFIARRNRHRSRNRQSRRHRPLLPPSSDEDDPLGDLVFA
jgi:hypothetical protein